MLLLDGTCYFHLIRINLSHIILAFKYRDIFLFTKASNVFTINTFLATVTVIQHFGVHSDSLDLFGKLTQF